MLPQGRAHQTALVFDLRGAFTGEFAQRARRLLDCLNDQAIKVDVYGLIGNTQNTGPALIRGTNPEMEVNQLLVDNEDPIDLNAWSKDQGYVMLLVGCPTGGNPHDFKGGKIDDYVAEGKGVPIDPYQNSSSGVAWINMDSGEEMELDPVFNHWFNSAGDSPF